MDIKPEVLDKLLEGRNCSRHYRLRKQWIPAFGKSAHAAVISRDIKYSDPRTYLPSGSPTDVGGNIKDIF